ncbi:siderophore ABC transporter substrate-binding protein [Salipiger sp. IMCC34102]|uniref:siderophore ABC transporter substrate-binding protein n=1 Tax=Salipiger sp. IMCC34102 TaxID=2510647 RepID=UPI00101E198B|nr:siderophore ABC transporter substrate-binding protein [Salipiger sp. IMCC34102]RYH02608.1 siderophore ABC transporter substrate-binding protein [Salipiger sp. IMCC34102]
MKRVSLLLASLALPTAALAQTVDVQTATGETTAPTEPQTVVAFDLAAIDALDALGVTLAGVPDIAPPASLADAMDGVPTVGTLFEPDFEELAVMAPDLIIAGGRSQTQVEPLSAVAPTLDMTIDGTDLIGQAKDRVTAYGAIFGQEEEAEALNTELTEALAQGREVTAEAGGALIVMTNGGKISAYGDDSRFGWLHTDLGLTEAYPDLTAEDHGESISFEFIAEVNPDWILVVDRGAAIGRDGEAAAVTLDNPLVAGTTAGENDQIVYLDSAPLYLAGGGPRSLMGTIQTVVDAMDQSGD